MAQLTGKVALITGASRGIGAGVARRLAADGAKVAVTYSASAKHANELIESIKAAGGEAVAIKADAANRDECAAAVEQTVKAFGALDILVNNAGIGVFGGVESFTTDDYERMIAVNINAAFYTVRAAIPRMRDGGRIIFIGSVNSDSMPFAGGSVYALTKGAIAAFTRGLSRDLGPRAITVNNIQPGPIDTDLNPANGPMAATLTKLMALSRYGKVEEVAALTAFLAGPEGAFITGAGLKIDGGFDA